MVRWRHELGVVQRKNNGHHLALAGSVESRDFSWRKGVSELSIEGGARLSLATG